MQDNVPGGQILRSFADVDFTTIAVLLFAGWLFVTALEQSVPRLTRRLAPRLRFAILPWVPLARLVVILLLVVVVGSMIVQPDQGGLFALIGSLGLAIGFAFKDYASSLIAGVVVLFERPYSVGDWVRIGDVYGEVTAIGLRTIQIRTPNDDRVAVPHNRIWDHPISNANSGQRSLQCVADFYLRPDHDGGQVREKLYDVALTSPFVSLDRPVVVLASELLWATHYRVKAYPVDCRDQFEFASDITLRGRAALARLGVSVAVVPGAGPAAAVAASGS